MSDRGHHWTNPSVLKFAGDDDPIDFIQQEAKALVLTAVEQGWTGPPFDPFKLADLLKLGLFPNDDILDARTLLGPRGGLQIEFNPNRPWARTRYSVAHEIAHTLFPDCAERVRNRVSGRNALTDDWQLELLCNIGAAEILMPTNSGRLEAEDVDLDNLIRLGKEYGVSLEAIFLRLVKLTASPCAMFSASRTSDTVDSRYRVDYSVASRTFPSPIPNATELGPGGLLSECTAVGYTSRGTERWGSWPSPYPIECIGIPAFPGKSFPRILGLVRSPSSAKRPPAEFRYITGDARLAKGDGRKVVAQIVNDRTANWGAGFALSVKREWPMVQEDFRNWVGRDPQHLSLGRTRAFDVHDELCLVSMIAQRGYGPASRPRIRYRALQEALADVAEIAKNRQASVHMPRIGTGQAGGHWGIIRELIDEALVQQGVNVTVYDLPGTASREVQGALDFSRPASGI